MNVAARSSSPLVESPFVAGFECSCHVLSSGRRLDMIAATRHAELADQDYAGLRALGIQACREGVSWATCEWRAGRYDFSSVLSRQRAATKHGVQVIWDLMHFGWPDDLDVFAPRFPERFARYAAAFTRWLTAEADSAPMLAPINEISYLAWAGGDVACMNPFELARGVELKVQLVRACIACIDAVRGVTARARFLQPEPVINIVPDARHPKTWRRVQSDNLLAYQAWDMLSGRVWPELGGGSRYLDVIGVNFYPDNQFKLDGTTVQRGSSDYKPFSSMLLDVWQRYRRPMLIAETGSEGPSRASWIEYVADESAFAMQHGCALHGVTLYPVLDHPGWDDQRHCENGLWGYPDERGARPLHEPLAAVLRARGPQLLAARVAALAPREATYAVEHQPLGCSP